MTAATLASIMDYRVPRQADAFTVDYLTVLEHSQRRSAVILDVRPADFYSVVKADEAPGHIPGAVNRPFSADPATRDGVTNFKPVAELEEAHARLIPFKDSTVVVTCRTGHQASQTRFVLQHLLGYRNVLWYDGGGSEWASRPELPVETTRCGISLAIPHAGWSGGLLSVRWSVPSVSSQPFPRAV